MSKTKFVHLHVHSEFSLLDGAAPVRRLVEATVENEMPALALTDHGNMHGAVTFATQCQDAGVQPIVGSEIYTSGKRPCTARDAKLDRVNHHLVLLAKNEVGYKNLIKIVSEANTKGFYYKPRADYEILSRYKEGIIATSGCLGSEICSEILRDDIEAAQETAGVYRDIFGPEHYYVEIQDHGQKEDKIVNPVLIDIAKNLGLGLVATNDIHYIGAKDADHHDTLLCIGTQVQKSKPDRMRYPSGEFYFKTGAEMAHLFREQPTSISNTIKIAEMVDFKLEPKGLILPHYAVPEGETYESWFEKLCWVGAKRRYPNMTAEQKARIEYEIDVIEYKGYAAYFLIVEDFVRWAHSQGIPARCRGSAAGSVVSYLLNITNIDPLEYGLLFERFFYRERITPPDIDLDFADYRRQEVLEYCRQKYGNDHVANIVTFGTLGPKMAVRDISRALGVSLFDADRYSKAIPTKQGKSPSMKQMLGFAKGKDGEDKTVKELSDVYSNNPQMRAVLDTVLTLEGINRQSGVHAAGVVITPTPITDYCPVIMTKDKTGLVTQYDMNCVSQIGLLKMDFLGLKTLTVVEKCIQIAQEYYDLAKDFDIDAIPKDDKKTFKMLQEGRSAGVFQLESSGMRRLVTQIRPESISDIIPLVALYRPGPLGNGDTDRFIARRNGTEPIEYVHEALKPFLKDTYGIFVYQDQILQVAMNSAGLGAKDADDILRCLSKKKKEKMKKMKPIFISGLSKVSGVPKNEAETIWATMESFAKYGFNRNHSGAYAMLSYQTAWLKANYPVAFMAALMTSVIDNTDKVSAYIDECKQMGIPVLQPDINKSVIGFSVEKTSKADSIRFGLNAVKGIGDNAVLAVIKGREKKPYTSLFDFCKRVNTRQCTKACIETMTKTGALDEFGIERATLMEWLEPCFEMSKSQQKYRESGQSTLFDVNDEKMYAPQKPVGVVPYTKQAMLLMEKEGLGFYATGHPLDEYADVLKRLNAVGYSEIEGADNGETLLVAGIVSEVKLHITKEKKQQMAFITIEDRRGKSRCILFPKTWDVYFHHCAIGNPIIISGKVQCKTVEAEDEDSEPIRTTEVIVDAVSGMAEALDVFSPATKARKSKEKIYRAVFIDMTELSSDEIAAIKPIIKNYAGNGDLVMRNNGKDKVSSAKIKPTETFVKELVGVLGDEFVWAT